MEISCLLFADDIILAAKSEYELHCLLNRAHEWSILWDITLNSNKCNVIHHRAKSVIVSENIFTLGNENCIKTVQSCRYLGLIIDGHIDYISCTDTLFQSGTRALRALIHKNKVVDY